MLSDEDTKWEGAVRFLRVLGQCVRGNVKDHQSCLCACEKYELYLMYLVPDAAVPAYPQKRQNEEKTTNVQRPKEEKMTIEKPDQMQRVCFFVVCQETRKWSLSPENEERCCRFTIDGSV